MIDELGLAGFFLLHWEVLELAREIANGIRGPGSPRRWLPPGRGRGSSVGSIVCYLTGLSHVDPVAQNLSLGRFLNRELMSVPDIDLDFPRDIREQLILGVTERYGREHASLVASFSTYRARGAIRDVGKALGLPFAELERLARVSDGWNAKKVAEELQLLPEAERRHALAALARLRRADARDRRPAAPHLAAPGRDGDLLAAADRARPRPAGGDGRPPALPVGQGLVRRRGLPQDRPARARDALGGRGLRRADRGGLRRADRPLPDPARRQGGLRGDPEGRHDRRLPDREPRADAEPAADEAGEPRRPDRAGRARAAGADPGQGRAPVHRRARAAAGRSRVRAAGRPRAAARAAPRHARRRRLPGPGARGGDGARRLHDRRGGGAAAGDEPEAERGGDRGLPGAVHRRRGAERRRRARPRTASTTSWRPSPASASRSRTRPRSACSPTSRPGCATTIRPSSSARS